VMRFRTKDDRNVKSLVSCLFLSVENTEKDASRDFFFLTQKVSILHNAHDQEGIFSFF
jgi:hypothetical protein